MAWNDQSDVISLYTLVFAALMMSVVTSPESESDDPFGDQMAPLADVSRRMKQPLPTVEREINKSFRYGSGAPEPVGTVPEHQHYDHGELSVETPSLTGPSTDVWQARQRLVKHEHFMTLSNSLIARVGQITNQILSSIPNQLFCLI